MRVEPARMRIESPRMRVESTRCMVRLQCCCRRHVPVAKVYVYIVIM
jgi:hypothetical protein